MTDSLSTKSRPNKTIAVIGLFLLLQIGGCSTQKVASQWHPHEIVADGSESEWPGTPQFYDERKNVSIRLSNDAESIRICFATGDRDLKMALATEGISVWFDPDGEKNKVVGIYVPGGRKRFRFAEKGVRNDHSPKPPELKLPAAIEMTYSETTGPLKMDLGEVRRTGIGIGAGQPDGSRYVYEFIVPFAVDEVLSEMGPGKVVGVGIMSGNGQSRKGKQKPSMGAMGGRGGGGRGGTGKKPGMSGNHGGGGKSGFNKPSASYEAWLKVQLAATES